MSSGMSSDMALGKSLEPPVVALRGIAKYFPGVVANQDVDLEVRAGEIHALLGENGAGKSTLMNILTGIYQPDAGQIFVDGEPVAFGSPSEAIAAGIGMVHQHFKLVDAFTVAENIHLGWRETPRWISAADLEARTTALAARFNLELRPGARIADISAGEQQRVEILRVLTRAARVLILDEPTAVLTPPEARELFKALRAFRDAGNAVIFISHKLDEVLEISSRITVLRGGRKVATRDTKDCTYSGLANLMVGRDVVLGDFRRSAAVTGQPPGKVVLALSGVSARSDRALPALVDIDLALRAGEILGVAGVAGNGQAELSEVLTGIRPISGGTITIDGMPANGLGPADFVAAGVGHIPSDRLRSGLAPSLDVSDNAVFREYKAPPIAWGPLFRPASAEALARGIATDAEVAVPSFGMPVRNLSGGNQQRLVARREMRVANKLLVAAYPSRGLDVGAINTMLRYLVELRDQGMAVVLISEELDELLNLCDRLIVLYEGRIMGTFDAKDADLETIGLLMGGKAEPRARVA